MGGVNSPPYIMNKIISYLVGFIMVSLALIPPIDFRLTMPGEYWPYLILIVGFLGFYLVCLKTSNWIKSICLISFLNCFTSNAPMISFNAYVSVVACCYFYVLCEKVKDYRPIFSMLQCLVVYEIFFVFMQFFGKDVLLNFHVATNCFATVGQHMQMASFAVILSSVLIVHNPTNILFPIIISFFCNSVGGFLSSCFGILITVWDKKYYRYISIIFCILLFTLWLLLSGKYNQNISFSNGSRIGVWFESIKLSLNHPFFGYGIGTYQHLFPILSFPEIKNHTIPWKTAHNCWLQLLFEMGIFGLSFFIFYSINLCRKLFRLTKRAIFVYQARICLAGLAMIGVNMMFHFPTRMIQTVPMIIFFLTYCEKVVKNGRN